MTMSTVARCGEVRRFGVGVHARTWQCRLQDPHPLGREQAHDFGIDAEVFGRDLGVQRPEWLAANLRDAVAKQRHLQRRIEEVQAVAIDILLGWATGMGVTDKTIQWAQANAPEVSSQLGWERV